MKCDRCHTPIDSGEERDHQGKTLCEDCYMDALSTVKACDPWAVHAARSMSADPAALTRRQRAILDILKETGGIELEPLADRLGMRIADLSREMATLRHMEKLTAAKVGDKKVFRLWR